MRRYMLAIVTVGLSGVFLALLACFLTPDVSSAPPAQDASVLDVPDLIIDVQAYNETVLANEVLSYTLVYTNTLDQSLDNVVILSTMGAQQYYSGSYLSDPLISTGNFSSTGNFDDGYIMQWELGSLTPQARGWIVITSTLPPDAEPVWKDGNRWPLLGVSAVITTTTPGVSTGGPEGEEGDSASIMVVGPVLQFGSGNKKSYQPNPVRPGRLLIYTLPVANKDREDVITAHGLVITDAVPANTTFQSASGTGFYSPTTGWVIWQPPDPLPKGGSMAVSYTVRVDESLPSCPPPKIENHDYGVYADETLTPVFGKDADANVDDVLEKTIQTPDPPSPSDQVFPGGIVTYTISIYNPRHDQAIAGLRLTDTLPGSTESYTFTFLNMVGGGPTPIATGPEVVWDYLSVPAGGMTSFSFRAKVPYHIDVGSKSKNYNNALSASVPGLVICDMDDTGPSHAEVIRQIQLSKGVAPDHVLSGETVTYTITLENVGNNTISSIRLTDTLPVVYPANFYYVRMISGPPPVITAPMVVWDGLSVPGNSEISLSFEAVAIGWPLEKYGNGVSASSPWTTIPSIGNKAKVLIDSPLTIGKQVTPQDALVGESVHYDVEVCNVAVGTYTLAEFTDVLPTGFRSGGSGTYVYDIVPDVALDPGECWEHGFDVDVTIDVGCSNLPKTYRNEKANLLVHVVDPVDVWFASTANLAPLHVNPHVTIQKEADHKAVLPGETIVYTVTLENASDIQINNVTVIDTLPGTFEYVGMVPGPYPAPDSVAGQTIEWHNQTIPASGQLVLPFEVLVPLGHPLNTFKNDIAAATTDLVCIEDINPTASVKVVDELIQVTKSASPGQVAPNGIVRYTIKVKNLDSVPISGIAVTDTLPSAAGQDFEFIAAVGGYPAPDEVNGRQVIWRDLIAPGSGTLELRFDVRATILFGDYDNAISATCPRTPITPDNEDVEATVTVLPGVVLYKTVYPTHTLSGVTVVYTITLNNQTQSTLENVVITDTLPAGFSYQRKLGDTPVPRQTSPVLSWDVGNLGKGKSKELVFEVLVGLRVVTDTYYNKVEGYSPSALIPTADETAPLEVIGQDLEFVFLPVVLRNYAPPPSGGAQAGLQAAPPALPPTAAPAAMPPALGRPRRDPPPADADE